MEKSKGRKTKEFFLDMVKYIMIAQEKKDIMIFIGESKIIIFS